MKSALRNVLIGLGASLLVACGGGGGDGTPAVTPPTAQASASPTAVKIGDTVTLSGAASAGNGPLTWKWTLAGRPANSNAILSNTTAAQPSFVADKPGDYAVDLIVNDGAADSTPARVTVTATSPYPVASTAPTISVQLGTETVGLNGSASTPPTGETGALSYLWTLKSRPDTSSATIRDYDRGNATLVVDVEGDYVLQLVVSYNGMDSEPAPVTVTVSSGNAPPVAVAESVTIKLGEEVTLDGSGSYDPDGQPLQYRWRWATEHEDTPVYVDRPELLDRETAKARFKPVAVGAYKLLFFVYDGAWKSQEIAVDVTVEKPAATAENKPPVGKLIASGYYPSSSVGEQELGLRADFTFEGYDPEGEALQLVSTTLVSKPAGSTAVLEERFPGWGMPTLQKIQKLDLAGEYKVRMTVSDGVNQVTSEATMRARIGGINNRPLTGSVTPVAASALVGNAIIFEADIGTRDPDGDPLTYHWTLFDKPNGSKATLEPLLEPASMEYRRARVVADVPGVYIAQLVVEDDRGMRSISIAEASAIAKLTNTPPILRRVVWSHSSTPRDSSEIYQMLPCMRLTPNPIAVDADGDKLYTHRELISSPAGSNYGQNRNNGCSNNNYTFNLPGEYVFRYLVSDGIDETPYYDFKVVIDPISEAKGVMLEEITGATTSPQITGESWPYATIPRENSGSATSTPATANMVLKKLRLTAVDGDYTIVDIVAEHINGSTLTPWFDGLSEGKVITKGQVVDVALTTPPFNCLRNEETLYEGFRFKFRIKEIPQATFILEDWRGAILNNGATPWPACATP